MICAALLPMLMVSGNIPFHMFWRSGWIHTDFVPIPCTGIVATCVLGTFPNAPYARIIHLASCSGVSWVVGHELNTTTWHMKGKVGRFILDERILATSDMLLVQACHNPIYWMVWIARVSCPLQVGQSQLCLLVCVQPVAIGSVGLCIYISARF